MKYHEILAALQGPLLITPAAHAGLAKLFDDHRSLPKVDFQAQRDGVNICGEAVELDQAQEIDGVYCIPIAGPIGRGLGAFEKGAGAVDVDDIISEIRQAESSPTAHAILFDVDCPGGMARGTPELADAIAACTKRTVAFTGGTMASAAYWAMAGCDEILATKSAQIGSIGVYVPYVDTSRAAEAQGAKVEVFTSGKFKGAGLPGTSLTDDHRAEMQRMVDELAGMFKSYVQSRRPDIDDEDMEGQAFFGENAVARGFVDELVSDFDQALGMFALR